jgi:hypothetical protein
MAAVLALGMAVIGIDAAAAQHVNPPANPAPGGPKVPSRDQMTIPDTIRNSQVPCEGGTSLAGRCKCPPDTRFRGDRCVPNK